MATTVTLHLPSLQAEITGEVEEGIACFRAIPFATVAKRWTHSVALHTLPESPFDATKYGPRCSQGEGHVLVTGAADDPVLPEDTEFNGLHLNVAAPQEALKGASLPVMVWIHGYVTLSSSFKPR